MRHSGTGAPLAVGVIGCGWIARAAHLPLLARMPGLRVAAVADPDAGCRAAAARLAPGAAAYADYEELLDASGIDAVIIAASSGVHATLAVAALERGKHVYLEKPLATTLADGRRVLAAWRRAGVVGMTGFNYRFNSLYERAGLRLLRGDIGRVTAARSVFATAPRELAAWKRARASGGGVLLDLGSHHVDLVRHWLGAEVRSVTAAVRSVRDEDDSAALTMELGDGTLVQSLFSLAAVEDDRFEFYGEHGRLVVDRLASLTVRVDPPLRGPADHVRALARAAQGALNVGYALRKRRSPLHEPSFAVALAHFVAAARAGTLDAAEAPSFDDGYAALAVIVAAEESARSGRSVPVLGLTGVADTGRTPPISNRRIP
jgi:myo-inositol 2-dehydrogenase/D-chiro-inositol 1-dehydrogenase